jgi:hypothetical protein
VNHIAELQMQVAAAEAKLQAIEEGLEDLKRYLHSPKFHGDPMVNIDDIFLRLAETRTAALDAADAAVLPFITCTCGHVERAHGSYREYGQTHHYCEANRETRERTPSGKRPCECERFTPMAMVTSGAADAS